MKKIALISDTHSYYGEDVGKYIESCDEIWHAGDIGDVMTLDKYRAIKMVRAVFGNIDGQDIRVEIPEYLFFTIESLKVLIIHIGGYPGRYSRRAKELITSFRPDIFISGHSHILKIIPDKKNNLLHLNPGSCGKKGFHKIRTLILFDIDNGNIQNMRVVELSR